ncbi:MAG: hypothetical protein HQK77_05550 [Desulfobacterales bacterium]|nr:hypothetical protein [Desulfobacterales bacterium]
MGCKPVREEYKRKLLQFICYTGTVDELNKLAEAVGKPRGRIIEELINKYLISPSDDVMREILYETNRAMDRPRFQFQIKAKPKHLAAINEFAKQIKRPKGRVLDAIVKLYANSSNIELIEELKTILFIVFDGIPEDI